MAKQSDRIMCVFCGALAMPSDEDLIPKWLGKHLRLEALEQGKPEVGALGDKWVAGHDAHNLDGSTAKTSRRRSQTPSAWLLSEVCKPCNNEWMSGIERAATPLLKPLVDGTPTTLGPDDWQAIVRWAHLKWLSWDARCDDPAIPPETRLAFSKATEPMPNVAVLVGKYVEIPGDPVPFLTFARRVVQIPGGTEDIVIVTMRIEHLVLLVVGSAEPGGIEPREPHRFALGLACRWPDPPATPFDWDDKVWTVMDLRVDAFGPEPPSVAAP